MSKTVRALCIALMLSVMLLTTMAVAVNPTPSSNDANKSNGWAYVEVVSTGPGTITLRFVSTRNFYSCFEYRTDGDTSQMISATNYNTAITDGLYPYKCVMNSTTEVTLTGNNYAEVRMVFGAERDERFTWTKFTFPAAAGDPTWLWTYANVNGEQVPMWRFETAPHAWEQLLSTGLKISAADTICWPFRKAQFGWTGKIYQQTGEGWTPLATTIQWVPNEEGQKLACAKAPAAGVYALWGYWQEE
jgi:hypothetical protein